MTKCSRHHFDTVTRLCKDCGITYEEFVLRNRQAIAKERNSESKTEVRPDVFSDKFWATVKFRCTKGHEFEVSTWGLRLDSVKLSDGGPSWCIRCLEEILVRMECGVIEEVNRGG